MYIQIYIYAMLALWGLSGKLALMKKIQTDLKLESLYHLFNLCGLSSHALFYVETSQLLIWIYSLKKIILLTFSNSEIWDPLIVISYFCKRRDHILLEIILIQLNNRLEVLLKMQFCFCILFQEGDLYFFLKAEQTALIFGNNYFYV